MKKLEPQSGENVPADLKGALAEAGLAEFFADCTAAHRREYLRWISEAKREETRRDRIRKTISMLSSKRAQEDARLRKKR